MESNLKEDYYDYIFIGSGPVLLLDSINKHLQGKRVILLDSSDKIGGAWKTIDIFGVKGLENAVHYLIPNKTGYKFLEKYLGVKLNFSKKIYASRLFKFRFKFINFKYFDKLLSLIFKNIDIFSMKGIKNIFTLPKSSKSKYPLYGSKEIIEKIESLIKELNIKIDLNTKVKKIEINNNRAFITTNHKVYNCSNLVVSHGLIPPTDFYINSKQIILKKKIFRRPSLHIYYQTKSNIKKIKFSQVIFKETKFIKYAHELTQFLSKDKIKKNENILVCALNHNLQNNLLSHKSVLKELENYKIIHKSKEREKTKLYWQEIYLPMLNDYDLKFLRKKSKGVIKTIETEELCSSIAKYSRTWRNLKIKLLDNKNQ